MTRSLVFFSLLFIFVDICNGSATVESGIHLPDTRNVNGIELKKNGQGVRSLSFFGMNYDLYVAGLYSPSPLLTEEDIMESRGENHPLVMEFTFLRKFGKNQVKKAWELQTAHSISYQYDEYEKDVAKFIELLTNTIQNGGTQTVQMIEDETILIDQGVRKGSITGKEFQKAFLSMWFGEKAVNTDLKLKLLSGSLIHKEQVLIS